MANFTWPPPPASSVTITGPVTVTSSDYTAVDQASDRQKAFTWYDAGTSDQRPHTIVRSSVSLGITITETFTWAGVSGGFYLTNIART